MRDPCHRLKNEPHALVEEPGCVSYYSCDKLAPHTAYGNVGYSEPRKRACAVGQVKMSEVKKPRLHNVILSRLERPAVYIREVRERNPFFFK